MLQLVDVGQRFLIPLDVIWIAQSTMKREKREEKKIMKSREISLSDENYDILIQTQLYQWKLLSLVIKCNPLLILILSGQGTIQIKQTMSILWLTFKSKIKTKLSERVCHIWFKEIKELGYWEG